MTGLGLSFSLLTACGGGGGGDSKPVVTTIPNCTTASVYNQSTRKWTYSTTDSRECKALTNAQNLTCDSNQVKVRIPVTSNNTSNPVVNNSNQNSCINYNGQVICGTAANTNSNTNWNNSSHYGTSYNNNNNYSVNNNTNYHTSVGSYTEQCMDQNSQEWHYIVNAGSYYYLNYSLAYNDYQTYQYQYQYSYNKQLSPKETIIAFGVVAAALFFLSN